MDWLSKRLDKQDNDLERIEKHLTDIRITQVEQAEDIKYHIKRTDLIENMVEPMYKKYHQVIGAVKFVGVVATIAGIAETVVLVVKSLH